MRIYLLLLLFCFTQTGFSQSFTADLSKLEVRYPRSSSFSIDSVIDARPNKEILGYITNKKGKFHSTVFQSEELAGTISKAYNAAKIKGGTENIILRINRLFIYETTQNNHKYFNADLNVSFILETDSQLIERFTAAKMILFRANYGNRFVTPLVGELLDTCLLHYEKLKRSGSLADNVITTEQLTKAPDQDISTPGKRGLYYNFYDLRDHRIDTATNFTFEQTNTSENESPKVKLTLNDKEVSWKDIYAFSDGENIYVNVGRKYTQLTKIDGRYWLDYYPGYDESNQYTGGMIVSGIVGGIIGVGIYALLKPFPKGFPAYFLDFERGTVVPAEYLDSDKMSAETYIVGSSFLKNSDTLSISINDSIHLLLGKNQYLVLKSDYQCSPIKMCISANGNTICKSIQPILFKRQVVRCSLIKGKKLRITETYGSERQGMLHSIESGGATQVFK